MRRIVNFLIATCAMAALPQSVRAMSCEDNIRLMMVTSFARDFCPKIYPQELELAQKKNLLEIANNQACLRILESKGQDIGVQLQSQLASGINSVIEYHSKRCPMLFRNVIQFVNDTDSSFKLDLDGIDQVKKSSSISFSNPDIVVGNGVSIMPTPDQMDTRGNMTMSMKQIEKKRSLNQQIGKILKIEKDVLFGYDSSSYEKGGKFIIYLQSRSSSPSTIKCYIDENQTKQFSKVGFDRRLISVVGLMAEYTDSGLILNPCTYKELEK